MKGVHDLLLVGISAALIAACQAPAVASNNTVSADGYTRREVKVNCVLNDKFELDDCQIVDATGLSAQRQKELISSAKNQRNDDLRYVSHPGARITTTLWDIPEN